MSAILTCDLAFGDTGKGKIVSALTKKYNATVVVRYNGGAQAAHNVVCNGIHHTFSQFGAGTFNKGTKTFLGKRVLVNPYAMMMEAKALEEKGIENPLSLINIDHRCIINTPYHQALNRLREISRGANKQGSCGMGIGECVEESLTEDHNVILVRDIPNSDLLMDKLERQKNRAIRIANAFRLDKTSASVIQELNLLHGDNAVAIAFHFQEWFKQINMIHDGGQNLLSSGTIIFEGAQGALLHEDYGFPPYNTWSDTSFKNALDILSEIGYNERVVKIGVMRSYMTRHGAGPLVSESPELNTLLKDEHNPNNPWQDSMRFGWLDLAALKHGINIAGGVDFLAVTHVDVLESRDIWPVALSYESYFSDSGMSEWNIAECYHRIPVGYLTSLALNARPILQYVETEYLAGLITKELETPIAIKSYGAETKDTLFDFHLI